MKNWIKALLIFAVTGLVAYKSVYIKKLSDVLNSVPKKFDAVAYNEKLWKEQMPDQIDSAVDLGTLISRVSKDRTGALAKYSNLLGIGNNRYALIKTNAFVNKIEEDEILLNISLGDSSIHAILATEFIYGNAIRDASRLVDLKDFPVSTDLNNVSEEINKTVRTKIIPPFKASVKNGDKIALVAAIRLNTEHIKWNDIELIPLKLEIIR